MSENFAEIVNRRKWFLILFSILFVVSIPGIVLGFVFSMLYISIPSIIITVFGFYGLPVFWSNFGTMGDDKKVYLTIIHDGLLDLDDIAGSLAKETNIIKIQVLRLINKRYLIGYKLNKEGTALEIIKKPTMKKGKCEYCGGAIPKGAEECPYCKNTVV